MAYMTAPGMKGLGGGLGQKPINPASQPSQPSMGLGQPPEQPLPFQRLNASPQNIGPYANNVNRPVVGGPNNLSIAPPQYSPMLPGIAPTPTMLSAQADADKRSLALAQAGPMQRWTQRSMFGKPAMFGNAWRT